MAAKLFRPPEERKTFISWVDVSWKKIFQPPEKKKVRNSWDSLTGHH